MLRLVAVPITLWLCADRLADRRGASDLGNVGLVWLYVHTPPSPRSIIEFGKFRDSNTLKRWKRRLLGFETPGDLARGRAADGPALRAALRAGARRANNLLLCALLQE